MLMIAIGAYRVKEITEFVPEAQVHLNFWIPLNSLVQCKYFCPLVSSLTLCLHVALGY